MAISEKDIFQSLMKDPNHAYRGLEKVWAEAQQRARQFRNNEKALSLALDDSPLNKLLAFVSKAEDDSTEAAMQRGAEAQKKLQEAYEEFLIHKLYVERKLPEGVSNPFRDATHRLTDKQRRQKAEPNVVVSDDNQPGKQIMHGDKSSAKARYEKSITNMYRILNDDTVADDYKWVEPKRVKPDTIEHILNDNPTSRLGLNQSQRELITPKIDSDNPDEQFTQVEYINLLAENAFPKASLLNILTSHIRNISDQEFPSYNPEVAAIYNMDTLEKVAMENDIFGMFPKVAKSEDGKSFVPIAGSSDDPELNNTDSDDEEIQRAMEEEEERLRAEEAERQRLEQERLDRMNAPTLLEHDDLKQSILDASHYMGDVGRLESVHEEDRKFQILNDAQKQTAKDIVTTSTRLNSDFRNILSGLLKKQKEEDLSNVEQTALDNHYDPDTKQLKGSILEDIEKVKKARLEDDNIEPPENRIWTTHEGRTTGLGAKPNKDMPHIEKLMNDLPEWESPDDRPVETSSQESDSDNQETNSESENQESNPESKNQESDPESKIQGLIGGEGREWENLSTTYETWKNTENDFLTQYDANKDPNLPKELPDMDVTDKIALTKDNPTNEEVLQFREGLKSAWVKSVVDMSKNYPMHWVETTRNYPKKVDGNLVYDAAGNKVMEPRTTKTLRFNLEEFSEEQQTSFNKDMTERALIEGWIGVAHSALHRRDEVTPTSQRSGDLSWHSARGTSVAPPIWPTAPSGDVNNLNERFKIDEFKNALEEAGLVGENGKMIRPQAAAWKWYSFMDGQENKEGEPLINDEGHAQFFGFMQQHKSSNRAGGLTDEGIRNANAQNIVNQVAFTSREETQSQKEARERKENNLKIWDSVADKLQQESEHQEVRDWVTNSPKNPLMGNVNPTRLAQQALASIGKKTSDTLTEDDIEALSAFIQTPNDDGTWKFKLPRDTTRSGDSADVANFTDAEIEARRLREESQDPDGTQVPEGTQVPQKPPQIIDEKVKTPEEIAAAKLAEDKAREDAAKLRATTNKKINRIMREQFGTGVWRDLAENENAAGRESSEEDTSIMFDWLKNMPPDELDKNYNKLVVEEHIKQRAEAKKKAPATEPLDDASREELISRIKDAYSNMHPDTEVPDNFSHMLSTVDDKELRDQYKAYMKREMDHHSTEANTQRKLSANDLSSFTPLEGQDGVDNADVLFQARRLNQHESKYGLYIDDKAAKEKLSQLKDEVKAKAEEFGMDITDLASQDKTEAEEAGITYGSDEWMDYVNDKHVEEANTAAEQAKYIEENGADLRGNVNYKPHIVVDYDENGNGRLYDLASKRYVNKEDLQFSDDHIADPWKSDDDSSAEEAFWDKIDYETLLPKNADGEVESIERFKNTAQDPRETNGFFHPESGAWINPHRYHETMQNGVEDLIIPVGGLYQGANKNQGDNDPMYSFSKLSSRQQGKMSGSDGYFIDTMGNIHGYAAPGHKNQDSKTPQSVNDVVYNWYSQQIAQRMQEGEQSSVIPVPSATPSTSYESALARRGKEVSAVDSYMGYDRGFLGRPKGKLTDAELGMESPWWQQQRWMGVLPEEWRQKFLDVVEYPQFQLLSGLGKVLVNGYGTAAGAARRARYAAQIAREAETKTRSQAALMNQDYLSPGEERARKEDVQQLHTDLAIRAKEASRQVAEANKAATEATKNGNEQQANQYKAEADKQKRLADNLGRKIDSLKPLSYGNRDDWGKINTLYNEHQSEFPDFGIRQQQPVVTQDTSGRRQVADIPAMPQQGMTTPPTQQPQPSGQGLQGLIGGTSTPQPSLQGLISGGEQPQTENPAPQEENKPPLAGLI